MVPKTTSTKVQDLNLKAQGIKSTLKRVRVRVETATSSATNQEPHHHTMDLEVDGDVTFVTVGITPF